MPRSKNRKKSYKPRQGNTSSLLENLPLLAAMIRRLDREMNDRLLRMKFSGINGPDLAVLVISFGQAWVMAGQMNEGDDLRGQLEAGLETVRRELSKWREGLSMRAFDILLDLIQFISAIVSKSTKKEYEAAGEKLKLGGTVPMVDNFFMEMAKVGLLDVVGESSKAKRRIDQCKS